MLVVTTTAPTLPHMKVPLFTAHFFTFYFACMNFVTPPVAMGAIIAAKLGGAKFMRTAVESSKAALGGFIVPFLLVFTPVLLLRPEGPISITIVQLVSSFVIIWFLITVITNYYLVEFNSLERFIAAAVAVMLIVYMVTQEFMLFPMAMLIAIALTISQVRRQKRLLLG